MIVTSYVFKNGVISWENLDKIRNAAGKEHLVLDLSCRKKDGNYYIVTDRWQKFTEEIVTLELMEKLGSYCDEFLVHAVDVEGKAHGVENELAELSGTVQSSSGNLCRRCRILWQILRNFERARTGNDWT